MQARVAVVGHVEWVDFAVVPRLPRPGEILHVHDFWAEAAGGGAVAAVQMAKLAGGARFITALARDELGRRTAEQLAGQGVTVHAAPRPGVQRRAPRGGVRRPPARGPGAGGVGRRRRGARALGKGPGGGAKAGGPRPA